MSNKKRCGIYEIKNTENGKRYIGQTKNSFKSRWKSHKKDLKKNNHVNEHLQRSWNKYDKEAFEFNIVERIDQSNFDDTINN